jgi:branched-chain amino acid transport system permease protein
MLPEFLRVFQDFDIVVYGLMLILMTMFMPGGLISGMQKMVEFAAAKMKKKKDNDAQA